MSTKPAKDTIYIDIDDEITSIIDKVEASKQKIVALVLPKRAAVLQSIVNMRLLKRSVETVDKSVVLITSDSGILPLAGAVGLYVAKNLQSKPAIPPPPEVKVPATKTKEEKEELEPELDGEKPVGELADLKEPEDDTETIALDNEEDDAQKKDIPPKDKKLKVPNFDRFRKSIILGVVGLVGLIIGLFFMLSILPKAKITIKTDSSSITTQLEVKTSGKATQLDEQGNIIPSQIKETKQTGNTKVAATGKKNVGEKASGEITIVNCSEEALTIPSGTTVVSNGLAFVIQAAVLLGAPAPNTCPDSGGHTGVANIKAINPGIQYNLAAGKNFSVTGYSSDISGSNAQALSGGTDNTVTVVSQQDIDSAKQKIATGGSYDPQSFHDQLADEGYYVLPETATTSDPKITSTPKIGEEASEVTVTQEATYSVIVVKKADLTKLVANVLDKQIDTTKQKLSSSDVLEQATVRVGDKTSPTDVKLNISKTATVVPVLNVESIKQSVGGKKRSEIQNLLGALPGVKDVTVSYSPFWVSKAPKKPGKITIVLQGQTTAGNESN